jgi:cytoskeletal protein CcmA (bactofilin family)
MSLFSHRSEAPMADSWSAVKEVTPRQPEEATEAILVVEAEDEKANGRIGKGSRIVGTLRFEGSVRIYGEVEGEIIAVDAVIVRRGGRVTGDVRASRVVIEGDATADVRADRVEIGPTGRLLGNVVAPRLVIHEGAIFDGSCAMAEAAHPAEASSPRAVTQTKPASEPLPLAS